MTAIAPAPEEALRLRQRARAGQRAALAAVDRELERQVEKWDVQSHSAIEWTAILAEEVGEAAKEAVELRWHPEDASLDRLCDELAHVAAVAAAAIEALRRTGGEKA